MEEQLNQFNEEINTTDDRISQWIKKGNDFIFPDRLEEWKSCVEARANGMYNGKDLDIALDIIEKLDKGSTLWEARQLIENENHSQGLYSMISQIVFAFSKQGPEFLEYIMDGNISLETRKAIETKSRENMKLSLIYNKIKNNENLSEDTKENAKTSETLKTITQISEDTKNVEETSINSNNYLQIRKDNIFTKIVTFIRRLFFSKKYKDNISTDNSKV